MATVVDILNPYLPNPYLQALAVLVAFFILSKFSVFACERILLRLARKTKTKVDDLIIERTNRPVSLILLLLGIRLAIEALRIQEFWEDTIAKVIYSFTLMMAGYVVIVIVDILIDGWGKHWAARTKSTVDDQLIRVLHRFSKILFAILAFLFVLNVWGIEIGPLLASLGIAGIAVAFALQSTLGNIFGGISLIIDKTIKVGDVIQLDAATKGRVLDVGLRSTKIRTFDNEVIVVPNGKLADSQVHNYAPPDPSVRVVIPFSVAYGSTIEKVKKLALAQLKGAEGLLKEPEPYVRFIQMGTSSLDFKLYFYVEDHSKRFKAKDHVNTNLYNALNKAKISIPFPQMDVHLKKE